MGFGGGVAPPGGVAAVGAVPGLSEGPALLEGEGRTVGLVPVVAPAVDVLFRPEKQHRLSGVDEVVPPMLGRDGEVDYTLGGGKAAALHAQFHCFATVATGCDHLRVPVEHGRHA